MEQPAVSEWAFQVWEAPTAQILEAFRSHSSSGQ